jgi:hypothetical protein
MRAGGGRKPLFENAVTVQACACIARALFVIQTGCDTPPCEPFVETLDSYNVFPRSLFLP